MSFNKQALMYGLVTDSTEIKPLKQDADLFKKLKTPKRGRGAPRRFLEQSVAGIESSDERPIHKLNKSMKAPVTRSGSLASSRARGSFMAPTAASKKRLVVKVEQP